jgi:hypothetical protein
MPHAEIALAGAHLELFKFENGEGKLELNMNWHGIGVDVEYVRSKLLFA